MSLCRNFFLAACSFFNKNISALGFSQQALASPISPSRHTVCSGEPSHLFVLDLISSCLFSFSNLPYELFSLFNSQSDGKTGKGDRENAPPRALDFPELWEAEQSVQQGKPYQNCNFYLPIKPLNKCLSNVRCYLPCKLPLETYFSNLSFLISLNFSSPSKSLILPTSHWGEEISLPAISTHVSSSHILALQPDVMMTDPFNPLVPIVQFVFQWIHSCFAVSLSGFWWLPRPVKHPALPLSFPCMDLVARCRGFGADVLFLLLNLMEKGWLYSSMST